MFNFILLYNLPFSGHGTKTGTNLFAALSRVNERIAALKKHAYFNETQNVIVIETDGKV